MGGLPIKNYPKGFACDFLRDAVNESLSDESGASKAYENYAEMARAVGLEEAAAIFEEMAEQERLHKGRLDRIMQMLNESCPDPNLK